VGSEKEWNDIHELDESSEMMETQAKQESDTSLKLVGDPSRKKKKSNKYFYKVANHHELFKIGRSFHTDYVNGVSSFAIASTGYQTSQQKTILGLASFFDHKEDLRIGIISDNLYDCVFKNIVKTSDTFEYEYDDSGVKIEIHNFHDHFEFIDFNKLIRITNRKKVDSVEDFIEQIVDQYDIVFWDVPELFKIENDSEAYFPYIMKYESISIIVTQKLSKKTDIDEIKQFFIGYGINLKGLLFDEHTHQNKEAENNSIKSKKPWWRIF
jgi:hypothetical protein